MPGPKLGLPQRTHPGSASRVRLPMRTVACTGPSLVVSVQPSLSANPARGGADGPLTADPSPGMTMSRPRSSVKISPSMTGLPRNVPPPSAEGPDPAPEARAQSERTTSDARSETSGLRSGIGSAVGRSRGSSAPYQAAFALPTRTRQLMFASAAVISPTTCPSRS